MSFVLSMLIWLVKKVIFCKVSDKVRKPLDKIDVVAALALSLNIIESSVISKPFLYEPPLYFSSFNQYSLL